MGDFRQLQAWREAKTLVLLSRNAIRKLPPDERFVLGDQWRRAAYSVALNIAEGASRRGPREFRRYLDIARSSLHELEGILELVELLEYLPREELSNLSATRDTCARLVYGLLRTMAQAVRRGLTT
jgi:four helix bundle protein